MNEPAVSAQNDQKPRSKNVLEKPMHILFAICGFVAIAFVLLITVYLILSGLPAIREVGLWDFLFGTRWDSTNKTDPAYGILPFILTSIYGTAGAILIGVPVGFFTAVYLAKVAPPRTAAVIRSAVDLLAAIIVLAVMILPSIISVSETALRAVPREYEEASLALGATELETYFRISAPAAKSGVAAAVVLGVGRAIGEAMAILMVAGNVANMPSLFSSVRFLTTAIASEMGYASVGSLQRNALYSIGLVLFLFILCINVLLNLFLKRSKEK